MVKIEDLKKMEEITAIISSKGNQNKWYADGKWYKEDALGYESLAEIVISKLLEKTTVDSYVKYKFLCRSMFGKNRSEPFFC